MPHWSDVVSSVFVRNVANRYVVDNPLEAFDIFPDVPTTKLAGYLAKYKKADWFRIGTKNDYKRTGATESFGDDYEVDKQSYLVEEFAFHKDITEDDRNEYDNPYDPVKDAISFCDNRIRRVLLQNLVDTYIGTGIWGTDLDLSGSSYDQWDAKTSGVSDANPVEYILDAKEAIKKTTGYEPNKLIITYDVFKALKTNTHITGSIKTTNDKVVTKDLIARLFELDDIRILDAVNSDADDFLVSGTALLVHTPKKPSKFEPSAGYHMVYKYRGKDKIRTQKILMEEKNNALRIELAVKVDPLVVASDLGYYMYNVVS